MPGEQDKQVKLSFIIDQSSVQKAKQAMNDLISTAQRLAETLQRANIGGIGGGGSGGMGTGTVSAGGGASGSQSPGRVLTTVAAQNPGNRVAAALSDNVRGIMAMAKAGGDAAKTLSESLKRSISDQERSVDSLQRKLTGLMDTFGKLNSTKMAPGGMEGGAEFASEIGELHRRRAARLAGNIEETAGALDTHQQHLDSLQKTAQQVNATATQSGTTPITPAGAAAAPGGAAGGGLMKALRAAGLVATAGTLANDVGVVTSFAAQAPMYKQQLAAQRANIWGGQYQAARGGDLTQSLAAMAAGGVDMTTGMGGAGFDTGDIVSKLGDRTGSIKTSRAMDIIKSALTLNTSGAADLGKGEWDARASTEGQKNQAEAMQNFLRTNPQAVAAFQQFQSEAGGQLGLQRALGLGGGVSKGYDYGTMGLAAMTQGKAGGGVYHDATRGLQAQVEAMGYDIGEYAGALSPLRQSLGTNKAVRNLAFSVMGGEAGGFAGIGGLAAQAGIGGSPQDFIRSVYGRGATGKMNQVASMGIGAAVAGSLTGGGIATSGLGAMGMFQAGFGPGTGGMEDLMMGRQAQAGMGALGGALGGSLDKYQAGMNFLNAGRSFGNVGFAAQGRLSEIFGQNPSLAADIMAGGAIPPELKAMGVTSKDQVAQYVQQTSKGLVGRATNVLGDETPAGKLMGQIQAEGGDIQGYMKAHNIHGAFTDKKGKKHGASKDFDEFRTELGAGLALSQNIDFAAGEGEAAGLMGIGSKRLHKGGAGAAGSLERQAIKDHSEMTKKNTAELEKMAGAIHTAGQALPNVTTVFGIAATDLQASAATISAAFDTAAEAALQFAMATHPSKDALALLKKLEQKHTTTKAAAPGPAGPAQGGTSGKPQPAGNSGGTGT